MTATAFYRTEFLGLVCVLIGGAALLLFFVAALLDQRRVTDLQADVDRLADRKRGE